MLSSAELQRYKRQIDKKDSVRRGREKLKRSRAFLAGAGGLGSPVAFYLAAAGIGTIRIVDTDKVETFNLNRQILHFTPDIGQKRYDSAAEKLKQLNTDINVEAIHEKMKAG